MHFFPISFCRVQMGLLTDFDGDGGVASRHGMGRNGWLSEGEFSNKCEKQFQMNESEMAVSVGVSCGALIVGPQSLVEMHA